MERIDLVMVDPAVDEVVLIMVVEDEAALRQRLLHRINVYLHFILEGDLVDRFPDLHGKAARIQVDFVHPPQGDVLEMLEQAQGLLLERGIKLAVNVLPD